MHAHPHGHAAGRREDRRLLRIALTVTLAVMVVEVVGGVLTGSLALIADAGHMATDSGAVVLALGASYLAARGGSERSTFGLHRMEVLAALANAVIMLGLCGWLAYAGVTRLIDPGEVEGQAMIGYALVGLLANAVSLVVLSRSETGSLNMRGAANEVLADLLGSVLAIAAGVVIWATGWVEADAIASLLIAVLIVPRALMLAKDALLVLMEVAPPGLDLADVREHLLRVPGVTDVHDLHAWTITSGLPTLSAHVTVTDECLAERGVGATLDELCACMAERFGVRHATFQVEPESHAAHEDLGELH